MRTDRTMREDSTVHRQSCNRSGLRYPSMDKSVERRGENADPICTLFPFRCGFIHAKYFASLYILTYVGYSEFARILRRIRVVHRFIYHVRPERWLRAPTPLRPISHRHFAFHRTRRKTHEKHTGDKTSTSTRPKRVQRGAWSSSAARRLSQRPGDSLRVVRPRRRRTR